jgi:thiol:disulfide interchange protein
VAETAEVLHGRPHATILSMASDRLTRIFASAICAALVALVFWEGMHAQAAAQGPPRADALVASALKTAALEHKVVLIEFGASWCTWCRRFNEFVHAPATKTIISANYVVVNLTVQERDDKKALENAGGMEAMTRWGGAKSGLPFYVFLSGEGKKIGDSNAMPDGTNVGFPGNPTEIQVFVGLLDRTAPRLGKDQRAAVVDYLKGVVRLQ